MVKSNENFDYLVLPEGLGVIGTGGGNFHLITPQVVCSYSGMEFISVFIEELFSHRSFKLERIASYLAFQNFVLPCVTMI